METSKNRKNYSLSFKFDAIKFAQEHSNRQAGEHYGVDESMVQRWRLAKNKLNLVLDKTKKTRTLEQRKAGRQVTGRSILFEARARTNSMKIQFKGSPKWVYSFMKQNNLVGRAVTSVGQQLPDDRQAKITYFKEFVKPNLNGIELWHIGNMDEVLMSFVLPSNFTIEERGTSNVKNTTTGHEISCFTVVLAITADGYKLAPYVFFKRKTKGNFPKQVIISANGKGWVSSSEMKL